MTTNPSDEIVARCLEEVAECMYGFIPKEWERRANKLRTPASDPSQTKPDLHPETAKMVADFAQALAEKLARAERKYGYTTEWRDDDWEMVCREQLMAHIAKGDPLDVAAYAAFMWRRGWSTAQPALAASQPKPGVELYTKHAVVPDFSYTYERNTAAERVIEAARDLLKGCEALDREQAILPQQMHAVWLALRDFDRGGSS